MRTSTSNSDSGWKISLAICSPSNNQSWRDEVRLSSAKTQQSSPIDKSSYSRFSIRSVQITPVNRVFKMIALIKSLTEFLKKWSVIVIIYGSYINFFLDDVNRLFLEDEIK